MKSRLTVTETLQAKLSGAAPRVLSSKPTENQEAYELYLKGRHLFKAPHNEADIKKALQYFQEAVARSLWSALAVVGVSDSYAILPELSPMTHRSPEIEQALAAARKATERDDSWPRPTNWPMLSAPTFNSRLQRPNSNVPSPSIPNYASGPSSGMAKTRNR